MAEQVAPDQSKKGSQTKKKKSPGKKQGLRQVMRQTRKAKSKQRNIDEMMAQLTFDPDNSVVSGTGLVYDERMLKHHNLWFREHNERPLRVAESYRQCQEYGLVDRCVHVPIRLATEEEILLNHSQQYVDAIRNTESCDTEAEFEEVSASFSDVYFNKDTFETARLSLGGCLELLDHIAEGKVRNGMAIVRPPGHHAMESEACGFCFLNNAAIAAESALRNHGYERVLIVDWDVHHGQGTQYSFYDDPRASGSDCSPLVAENMTYTSYPAWPGPQTGMGNSEYIAIFNNILMPIAYEFSPDLVIVSSGYDAALGCPEGEMKVTPACYAHLVNMLSTLAEGRLCVYLEGGYCVTSLSHSVAMTVRALLGDPCPPIGPLEPPDSSLLEVMERLITLLRPHWRCLRFQGVDRGATYTPPVKPDGVEFAADERRPARYDTRDVHEVRSEAETRAWDAKIADVLHQMVLRRAPHRTCLVYDKQMMLHRSYADPGHPESPARIQRIFAQHEEWGLLERCLLLPSRKATPEELKLKHSEEHVSTVAAWARSGKEELERMITPTMVERIATFLCMDTYDAGVLAAGSVLAVVDAVVGGEAQSGVAIVRPPGHHAEEDAACGFCFFNNVAIAAEYAKRKHGLKRVLIVDWDVHHGNGTQHMFYDDSSVLFISLHRYDDGSFFPGEEDANFDRLGRGDGTGFNINIAWNARGMGDAEYVAAFQQVVLPVAYQVCSIVFHIPKPLQRDARLERTVSQLPYMEYSHEFCVRVRSVLSAVRGAVGQTLQHITGAMKTLTMSGADEPLAPPVAEGATHEPGVEPLAPPAAATEGAMDEPGVELLAPPAAVEDAADGRSASAVPDVPLHSEGDAGVAQDVPFELGGEADVAQGVRLKSEGEVGVAWDIPSKSEGVASVNQDIPLKSEGVDQNAQLTSEGEASAARDVPSQSGTEGEAASGSGEAAGALGACTHIPGEAGAGEPSLVAFLGLDEDLADQDRMFAVVPKSWCPHLECVEAPPGGSIDVAQPCATCGDTKENWICLTCYKVFCGRMIRGHMVDHGSDAGHPLTLSFSDLSAWCYPCDAYVHHAALVPPKRAAHVAKFGVDLPHGSEP
ncbi:PREDICTED: histone deacetylase 6-like [Priapulus caudatus]|uniref:Histone deacetylase 6-like n=1 Tax=Priapulus caudatus TaxID=37621 RepID=A0ABM1EVR9_PRICU|nr:PREDICTED: histone deacetylase 6-like [Priapulus caudatus]